MASSLSASGMAVGLSTLAISICTLFWSMGVMTMKMISSTSITSTIGVTLMFELTLLPSLRTAIPIVRAPSSIFCAGHFRRRYDSLHWCGLQTGGQLSLDSTAPENSRSYQQSLRLALVALLDEVIDEFAG